MQKESVKRAVMFNLTSSAGKIEQTNSVYLRGIPSADEDGGGDAAAALS